jgi:cell division protein FtsI/penicillin-binding protein 2
VPERTSSEAFSTDRRADLRQRRVLRGLAIVLVGAHLAIAAYSAAAPWLQPVPLDRLALAAPLPRVPPRVTILDRRDRILAADTRSVTIHFSQEAARAAEQSAIRLGEAAGLPLDEVAALARRLRAASAAAGTSGPIALDGFPLAVAHALRGRSPPGTVLEIVARRHYPLAPLAGEILGRVDDLNRGSSGLERTLDQDGRSGSAEPVRSTLDIAAQHVLARTLGEVRRAMRATLTLGLVLDGRDGRVLAAAQSSSKGGAARPSGGADERSPPVTTETPDLLGGALLEPGALLAPAMAVLALEHGATLATRTPATGPLLAGPIVLEAPRGGPSAVSLLAIARGRSPIGAARIALAAGGERQQALLDRLGLLGPITWEAGPIAEARWPSRWQEAETAEIATGRLLLVSPVQLATGLAAAFTGGRRITPWLIDGGAPPRVITAGPSFDPDVASRLARLLRTGPLHGSGAFVPRGSDAGSQPFSHRSVMWAFPVRSPRWVMLVVAARSGVSQIGATREAAGDADGRLLGLVARRLEARLLPILAPPGPAVGTRR